MLLDQNDDFTVNWHHQAMKFANVFWYAQAQSGVSFSINQVKQCLLESIQYLNFRSGIQN